jgi:hypothetical protein
MNHFTSVTDVMQWRDQVLYLIFDCFPSILNRTTTFHKVKINIIFFKLRHYLFVLKIAAFGLVAKIRYFDCLF